MADTDYKQNGATSIISMLGSIVAALGFEITDNAKAAVTMLKMQRDLMLDSTMRDYLTGQYTLKTLQNIATGAWYVPGKLVSWIQKWLANNGGYDVSGQIVTDFELSTTTDSVTYSDIDPTKLEYFSIPINAIQKVISEQSIPTNVPIFYSYSNSNRELYSIRLYVLDNVSLFGFYSNVVSQSGYISDTTITGTCTEYEVERIGGAVRKKARRYFSLNTAAYSNTLVRDTVTSYKAFDNSGDYITIGHNIGSIREFNAGGGVTRGGGVSRHHYSLPKDENFPPCGGDTTVPQITEWSGRVINWNSDCYMPLTYFKVNPSNENPGTEPGSPNTPIEPEDPRLDPDSPNYDPSIPNVIIKYFYPEDYVQSTPQNGGNTVQTSGQLKDNYTNATNGPSDIPNTDIKGGLYTLWHPSADNLQKLGAFLYGGTTQGTIASIIGDPINAIIQLTEWAVTPVDGPVKSPVICNIGATELKMPTIPNQFMQFDCGTIEIPREYHDFRDYEPYTRLSLFLPFVGDVNISTNDCTTPHKIHVIYNIDFLSGVACAEVLIDEDVRYAYQAAMCAAIPVTSSDASRLLASLIGAAVGAVGGGVMGGIVGGTAGSRMAARSLIGGVSEAALSPVNGIQIQRTGSISANTGLLGEMKPYVLVTRPISVVADQYKSLIGQPYQLDGTLGSQKGFVKVREVHLDGITATEAEKTEIEQLLKEGVIL
jgi:hypothetical protein